MKNSRSKENLRISKKEITTTTTTTTKIEYLQVKLQYIESKTITINLGGDVCFSVLSFAFHCFQM